MDEQTEAKVYRIVERFSEPSSYAGLAGILGMAGISVPDPLFHAVALMLAGLCGVVAFLLPDSAKH